MDRTSGKECRDSSGKELGPMMENAGQYHASGVSNQSMGTVLWNNTWGDDALFESHSRQPRATLVDRCTGGFVQWRFGGDVSNVPNHLRDLTIWNLNATKVKSDFNGGFFKWWLTENDCGRSCHRSLWVSTSQDGQFRCLLRDGRRLGRIGIELRLADTLSRKQWHGSAAGIALRSSVARTAWVMFRAG